MGPQYDVTIITVRPGTQPKALATLKDTVADATGLLACWYSEIGALNQILILRANLDPAVTVASRAEILSSGNPFGIGEWVVAMTMDTYVAFDFLPPIKPGKFGPCYEVRTYVFKTDGLAPTVELWRKAVPGRITVSPLLTAMTSVTGTVSRFMHIWPYTSLDERARLRAKAVERRGLAAARRTQPSRRSAERCLFANAVFTVAMTGFLKCIDVGATCGNNFVEQSRHGGRCEFGSRA